MPSHDGDEGIQESHYGLPSKDYDGQGGIIEVDDISDISE